ncbi:MAG: glucose-6-phosphate 1-dehydrogenase [Candidatus Dependentiae bacterium]|nr:glucose-6-phosphate 1-dehydrogenase [Candidatus Dependentiae bacterium]
MKPCTIILFGATGDLAVRKIIPAIHDLMRTEKTHYRLIGVSREEVNPAFMLALARPYVNGMDEAVWNVLHENSHFVTGDFQNKKTYKMIGDLLPEDGADNRLVYCATASEFFVPITQHLLESHIIHRQDTEESVWHRIAYEKPFGSSGETAQAMELAIRAMLDESQVFCVDHFLAKKALLAFPVARMLDESFNDLWMHGNLESIQIIMNETSEVGIRGRYYDAYGALRDMVQNHALQAAALLLMNDPALGYPHVSQEKKDVLTAITAEDAILGQYEGYVKNELVDSNSKTETFAAIRLSADLPQWEGVPIFIKTGKLLATQKLVIHVMFRSNDTTRMADMPMAVIAFTDNSVALVIGENEIAESLTVTKGPEPDPNDALDAYGRVLEFLMQGDRTIFVSFEEIKHMWRIIDALKAQDLPVYTYAKGSNGPAELEDFCKRNHMKWVL